VGPSAGTVLSGVPLTGRRARDTGLVDHAFSERVSEAEAWTFCNRALRRPPTRTRTWPHFRGAGRRDTPAPVEAAERRATAALGPAEHCRSRLRHAAEAAAMSRGATVPGVVGCFGSGPGLAALVARCALRGSRVLLTPASEAGSA